MQHQNDSTNGNRDPTPVSPSISALSSNICDSLFFPDISAPFTPLSITNSQISLENHPHKPPLNLAFHYQEILHQYELCRSHLEEAAEEAEALRLQNASLRLANADLARRLSVISEERINDLPEAYTGFPLALLNDLQRLSLNRTPVQSYGNDDIQDSRTALPKSISIRSKGYMKLAPGNRSGRNRFHDLPLLSPQKVYVPVGEEDSKQEKETPALEFDAYPQGMFKTELCNKWQETGACPYGEQCQFAHGVGELRPVIRHPRYKTEICRMILSGGTCPYGHRCHFRHALSPQDRFLLSPLN